jgi:hypothetical protein
VVDHVPLSKFTILDVPVPKSGFGGCGRGQEIAECPRVDRLAFLVTGIGYGVMDGGKVQGIPSTIRESSYCSDVHQILYGDAVL